MRHSFSAGATSRCSRSPITAASAATHSAWVTAITRSFVQSDRPRCWKLLLSLPHSRKRAASSGAWLRVALGWLTALQPAGGVPPRLAVLSGAPGAMMSATTLVVVPPLVKASDPLVEKLSGAARKAGLRAYHSGSP